MPLNLSFTHLMVVFVVAMVVLGPDKLPEAARTLAKWVGQFRQMTSGLKAEVRETFGEYVEPIQDLRTALAGGVVAARNYDPAANSAGSGTNGAGAAGQGQPGPALNPALPVLGQGSGLVSPGPALPPMPALSEGAPPPGTFTPGPDPGT